MLSLKRLLFKSTAFLMIVSAYLLPCKAAISQETKTQNRFRGLGLKLSYGFQRSISSTWPGTSRGELEINREGHRISAGLTYYEQVDRLLFLSNCLHEVGVDMAGVNENGKKEIEPVGLHPEFTESSSKGIYLDLKFALYPYHAKWIWVGLGSGFGSGWVWEELNVYSELNGRNINIFHNPRRGFGFEVPFAYVSSIIFRRDKPFLNCQLGFKLIQGPSKRRFIEDVKSFWDEPRALSEGISIFFELGLFPYIAYKHRM